MPRAAVASVLALGIAMTGCAPPAPKAPEAFGFGAVWVMGVGGNSVTRIDARSGTAFPPINVGNDPSGIATGAGLVWVVDSLDGTVSRIDPGTNTVVQKIHVGGGPLGIVYAAGSVWVANTGDGTITRIDAESGRRTKTLQVSATELAFGAGTLWSSQRAAGQVVRIDPTTGKQVFAPIHVGNGPTGITFGHGAAWVANSLDGTVSRIDPKTNSVTAAVLTGNGPDAVAVDPRGIWVSNQFDGSVVRIDPGRNEVAERVSVGGRPSGLAMSGDTVLVAVRHAGAGHRGGTLVLRADRLKKGDIVDSIDSALSLYTYVRPFLRMTGDGLTAFNQVSGLTGTQPVPDLATSLPTPTDGGRTYTFRLRPGIRYSNGRPVQATDFRSTFERFYALGSPVTDYDGIVGGAQCRKHPKRCDLSRGIVADDRAHTVTFHLTRPDPNILYKLAQPFAYVLPGGTPRRPAGTHPLPATGPYVIATYSPRRLLRFIRNPFFHEWSRAARPDGYPDRIVIRIAGTADEAIRDVVDSKADVVWLSEPWTPDEVFEPLLRDCARGVQQGEDLGQRMQNCLTEHLALGFRRVVIIGADSPTLPLEILTSAFAALRDRDIVLGPSLDGGYYLMGARTVAPEMFRGITWGGPTVLRDTLRILKILGMAPVLLPQWYDVDTVEDLRRLAGDIMRLQEAGEPAPRATLKALAASLAGLVRGA